MENVNNILERQSTCIEFNNGKVKYFSLSTQHGYADTVEEAVNIILKADKDLNGKTPLACLIEEWEGAHPIPNVKNLCRH